MTVRDLDAGRESVVKYDDLPIGTGARCAIVVGAGHIGLEVAAGLLQRGLGMSVVERLDAPMRAVLDPDRAAVVRADLVVIGLGVRPTADLARNIASGTAAFGGVLGTAITRFQGLEIACTGLSERAAVAAGFDALGVTTEATRRAHYFPVAQSMKIKVVAERRSGRLLGAQIAGGEGAGKRIDVLATALWNTRTVDEVSGTDLSCAPPFSPVWDPLLLAAGETAGRVDARGRRSR